MSSEERPVTATLIQDLAAELPWSSMPARLPHTVRATEPAIF